MGGKREVTLVVQQRHNDGRQGRPRSWRGLRWLRCDHGRIRPNPALTGAAAANAAGTGLAGGILKSSSDRVGGDRASDAEPRTTADPAAAARAERDCWGKR
jgi:hypothetical protein